MKGALAANSSPWGPYLCAVAVLVNLQGHIHLWRYWVLPGPEHPL